jgi:hypothetical protein
LVKAREWSLNRRTVRESLDRAGLRGDLGGMTMFVQWICEWSDCGKRKVRFRESIFLTTFVFHIG